MLSPRRIIARKTNLTDRILDALASLCLRRSKTIIVISVLVALAAVAGGMRLSFDADILNLIPQNNRQVNDFRKVLRDVGTLDYHLIALQMPAGHDVHEYDALIDAIAAGYKANPKIEDVSYKIPNPLDFVDVILPKAMLLLSPDELRQVGEKLSDANIRESVARNHSILQTPQGMAMKTLVQFDPFNIAPILLHRIQGAGGGLNIDASSGYYLSADHSLLLILAKPKQPAQDVPFAKALFADGALIEANALKDFQKSAAPGIPLPKIFHSGGYVIATSDADLIRYDVIINVLGSFFGVLALFLYGFRRAASLGYASAPLALGLAMTFGLAGLFYGKLSQASAGFAALLAGLGIDFITVLYGRYVDERNRGAATAEAIRTMMRHTMPGVFVAAVTTAGTFFAFLATDFRGMTQLGFLTGVGILLFLLCVTFLLPALIVFSERKEKRRPKLYLHSFGAEKLIDLSIVRPGLTIAVWVIFIAICSVLALRLRFSDNIQDLRAKNNAGVETQEVITKKFGQSFESMMYVVYGGSVDEVLSKTYTATNELAPFVRDRTIASVQSISTFIPPVEQQRNKSSRDLHAGVRERSTSRGREDFPRRARRQRLPPRGLRQLHETLRADAAAGAADHAADHRQRTISPKLTARAS